MYSQLFPISLVTTIVFQLDVQVERDVAAVEFVAVLVGTGEGFGDFDCQATVFLSVLYLVLVVVLFGESLCYEKGT